MTTWTTYNPPTSQPEGKPSAVNWISYRRYRVTVEEIEELDDVLRDRLMALADGDRVNMHHWGAWQALERRYGFVVGLYGGKSRLATDEDRAKWAAEAEKAAEHDRRVKAAEKAKRDARNAKARERRNARSP